MDYIFKEWEERLSTFEDSVEKDLQEIRKCKAEMQQMQLDVMAEIKSGRYIRDTQRLVLSAPEIVIGNVDRHGNLFDGGSSVVVRGTQVGVQGAGMGGQVEVRAASIREIAEDPGTDGCEHVVGVISEVVSQARHIVIQSDDVEGVDEGTGGAFSAPTVPTGGSGVRIHADKAIDIHAAMTAESREEYLDDLIQEKEDLKQSLKDRAADFKESFKELSKELESLLADKEELVSDNDSVRAKYKDIAELSGQIESTSMALTEQTYAYTEVLSLLAETSRQLKCFKDEKSKIVKGDDFKQQHTGSSVCVTGETISLTSADGEGNLRDNEGSGISMTANSVDIAAVEEEGQLKENGRVSITAKNIDVATAGRADAAFDDKGELTTATYAAEGDFTLKSKNITIESIDYEVAESKFKEKQLTADSKIKLRAKTIEVSTEGSANVEVDDEGQLTKANYTAEGDIIVRSKTFTLESTDNDLENGETTEKALTEGGQVKVRAPKMEFSGTDSEGKLADGSTMVLASDKMFVGGTSKDVKAKKLQAVGDEMGLFADKTFEAQQGDGKAVVQLDGGNTAVGGSKTAVYGDTTINGKTDIKGDVTAPKATIDNVEAKSSFKSTNISDGVAVPAAPSSASLSAKLQIEEVKSEE